MADGSVEHKFRISPIDIQGRTIAPEVLSVANEMKDKVLLYAEKGLGDPALAVSLLEESAAAVSRVLGQHPHSARIRNLQAYLFSAFIRRVNRLKRREFLLLERLSTEPRESGSNSIKKLELEILVNEILARGDAVMRDMFYRRSQGFSWKEIGKVHGISGHAAESRFSQAVTRVRQKLKPL